MDDLDQLFDVSGRVAVITGGSRGLGRAIAEHLAAAGASVVITSRKDEACAAVADAVTTAGGAAIAVPAHMGDPKSPDRIVATAVDAFGGLDIVVNNAANALALPLEDTTLEAWDKSLAVNLRGPAFLVKAALPHLTASDHASVINMSSAGAFLHAPGQVMYAAAKAGLQAMTRCLASELAGRGIRVNAVAPGTFDTDMTRNTGPEMQEVMARASLLGRAADPSEILGLVRYLASDASSFVTGSTFSIDGGLVPR